MTLITAKPLAGVDSKDTKFGTELLLGQASGRAWTATLPRRTRCQLPPLGTLGPLLALLLACAFFASQTDRFLTGENFSLVLQQVMVVGVIAIGQTLDHPHRRHRPVLRHGHGARRHRDDQARGRARAARAAGDRRAASRVTALFGLVNGLLVTAIRLPPFIVTLGTLNIAFAITQLYSSAQTVTDLPDGDDLLGSTFTIGGTAVTYGSVLMLAAVRRRRGSCCARPPPGRHVYAVGNNPEAARLTGIPTAARAARRLHARRR